MGDQVTSISLLTAAMEINNAIGHALKETPSRIKESPLCDCMKTLKGALRSSGGRNLNQKRKIFID